MDLRSEIQKRRTFAISSHPDAGKTTLTEKLLLFGGAIQTAGAVAFIKENNLVFFAESEWMLKLARENFPSIIFHETSDFKMKLKQR